MKDRKTKTATHVNKLIAESSPYLVQHAHNPVNWYPWCDEALEKARAEEKPIFLSIGYSACHWCHVMQDESFSDLGIADLLNRHFVSIKVDREERPDLDDVFMSAVQVMIGRGGWPMTLFLTPDLKPFMGGTYFPGKSNGDTLSFQELLHRVIQGWNEDRASVDRAAEAVMQSLGKVETWTRSKASEAFRIGELHLNAGRDRLLERFDTLNGGFDDAPKFPQAGSLLFLLSEYRRTGDLAVLAAIETTLEGMRRGAIRDHLAGGFHRYTVDAAWQKPHFEKMLYDNALLAKVYTIAYRHIRKNEYESVARETLEFLLREMQGDTHSFYASISADNNGEEGAGYLWSMDELDRLLGGSHVQRFAKMYGMTSEGNFSDGRNVLFETMPMEALAREEGLTESECRLHLLASRKKLLQERVKRTAPAEDRKALLSWNALAISALATAGGVFEDNRYIAAARKVADRFLSESIRHGAVPHHLIGQEAKGNAFLDGYAFFVNALLDLYFVTLRDGYLLAADSLAEQMIERFYDTEIGGFFYTPHDADATHLLPVRPRKLLDGAMPSPMASALEALTRLHALRADDTLKQVIEETESVLAGTLQALPGASDYALYAASVKRRGYTTILLAGPAEQKATRSLAREARRHMGSGVMLLWAAPGLAGKALRNLCPQLRRSFLEDGRPTVQVIRGGKRSRPVTDARALRKILRKMTL